MDSSAFFFSPARRRGGAELGLSEDREAEVSGGSERGRTNVVMKIYGPNCVALVEFFLLPQLETEREGRGGREKRAVWFGLG